MKLQTSNPLLNEERIINASSSNVKGNVDSEIQTMTLSGTAQKSGFLIVLCAFTGLGIFFTNGAGLPYGLYMLAIFVGMIAYFVGLFVPKIAAICAPIYAISEGLVLGSISLFAESKFPGVAAKALCATFGVALAMFTGFSFGIFKVTEKLKSFTLALGGGLCLFYLLNFVVSLFSADHTGFEVAHYANQSLISYGISFLAIGVGALFLLLDFHSIANLHGRAQKSYEWVCAMGLLATLVWLYIELLKLFMKLQSRD